jgi:hypothetical protein
METKRKRKSINNCDFFKVHNFSNGWPQCFLVSAVTTPNYATGTNTMEWHWNWWMINGTLTGRRCRILWEVMGRTEICVNFVPHGLINVQKDNRLTTGEDFIGGDGDQLPTLFTWPCHLPTFWSSVTRRRKLQDIQDIQQNVTAGSNAVTLDHGSPIHGPPRCIVRPAPTFVNYVYTIRIIQVFRG